MEFSHNRRRPGDLSTSLVWALKFVWQSGPFLTLANAVVTVAQSVIPVFGLYLTKLVVDAVMAGITAQDKSVTLRSVTLLVVLSAIIALLDRVLVAVAQW